MVFIILDLNAPFDYMFEMPTWITMAIAATRMHRSQTTDMYTTFFTPPHRPAHCCQFSFNSHGILHNSGFPAQGTEYINATPVQMDRMGVTMRIVSEEHGTLHMRGDGSFSDIDEHVRGKPNGLRFNDNVERGV